MRVLWTDLPEGKNKTSETFSLVHSLLVCLKMKICLQGNVKYDKKQRRGWWELIRTSWIMNEVTQSWEFGGVCRTIPALGAMFQSNSSSSWEGMKCSQMSFEVWSIQRNRDEKVSAVVQWPATWAGSETNKKPEIQLRSYMSVCCFWVSGSAVTSQDQTWWHHTLKYSIDLFSWSVLKLQTDSTPPNIC